ncbi:molecular chaperone [Roseomonas terrae]|jgi:fimbrial chaperone protein|uniref:Molecular chaperone n=1 Tax=Neoroseomonas terrae TaxID=424799 RepID=A0ABS5EH78_9PROT|nr:fimbria/pilus periplasmic chaperone [Neoroseomonas terrae]MBR0650385.1 molecular chaperone [Neoroseomonas terrae]
MGAPVTRRLAAALGTALVACAARPARAQSLTVLPVNIRMAPGQMTAVLTVINQGADESSFQVRAYTWSQPAGDNELSPTQDLLVSPPLGTIAAGASQVVRVVLRRPAQDKEASYRILLDQIPGTATPGMVRIAVRLSIPIFAAPPNRPIAPRLRWRIDNEGGRAFLVAVNDGTRHESVRDISLAGRSGIRLGGDALPYILAGGTRRWPLLIPGRSLSGGSVRLSAQSDAGPIDQAVAVNAGR